ncbi:hypothetical protein DENSPDRAFT_522818 [Dentipellis sp. KUC8613]|nr:hypothetical protein DENSPDRAFT_522818 [Dentipellis sp. KUC8613]
MDLFLIDIPLNEYGFPSHSYRYHTLSLKEQEIEDTIKKIGQDYDDGILDFHQWRALGRYWMDKAHAISREIDEEMKAGPYSPEELLKTWGYTDEEATKMVQRWLTQSTGPRSTRNQNHFLYRRNLREH